MFEGQNFSLRFLRDVKVDESPNFEAIVITHAVIYVPGLPHQVGVEKAEEMERQYARVVADILELFGVPRPSHGVRGDDFSLLLSPF